MKLELLQNLDRNNFGSGSWIWEGFASVPNPVAAVWLAETIPGGRACGPCPPPLSFVFTVLLDLDVLAPLSPNSPCFSSDHAAGVPLGCRDGRSELPASRSPMVRLRDIIFFPSDISSPRQRRKSPRETCGIMSSSSRQRKEGVVISTARAGSSGPWGFPPKRRWGDFLESFGCRRKQGKAGSRACHTPRGVGKGMGEAIACPRGSRTREARATVVGCEVSRSHAV